MEIIRRQNQLTHNRQDTQNGASETCQLFDQSVGQIIAQNKKQQQQALLHRHFDIDPQ